MKQTILYTLVAVLAIGLVLAGMAGAEETVPGTIEETDNFSFLVPEGWQFTVFELGTIQVYNRMGSYMLELRKEGYNNTDADLAMINEIFLNRYEGTPWEEVEMLGLKFFKTTFEYGGKQQSLYNALKEGVKISIGMMGADHATEPTIQAVFKSIVIKDWAIAGNGPTT